MHVEETQNGLEIVNFREDDEKYDTPSSDSMLVKSNPTCSMTEGSCLSSESRSFELEYSDEELSVASADDDDGEDEEEESETKDENDQHCDLNYPSIRTLDLVIDEVTVMQNRAISTKTSTNGVASSSRICKPVSAVKSEKFMACPCCRSYVDCDHPKKKYRFPITPSDLSHDKEKVPKRNSLTSFVDGLWCQKSGEADTVSGETTSSMVKSIGYTINEHVLEGWLFKKGTGNDMFGSTYWKPRWCSLVMATIAGDDEEVPLLLVSWHVSMNPSEIIMLESSIAITVDQNEDDRFYCFDVVSTKRCDNANTNQKLTNGKLTKTFSAELEERDEWVTKINQSIRMYQRSKILSIRHSKERLLPPTSPIRQESDRRLRNLDLSGLSIPC